MLLLAAHDPVDHVLPHSFFKLLPFNPKFGYDQIPVLGFPLGGDSIWFTNQMLMTLAAAALCLLIFPWLARSYIRTGNSPQAPRGLQNLFESLLQFVREGIARPVLGPRTDEYIMFLWTLFFFILFCNLLGMLPLEPLVSLLTAGKVKHIGGTATGNLAVTGALALCSLFVFHFAGVREVYRQLVAGTYGHHGADDHASASPDEHHAEHAHVHGHRHSAGTSGGAAAIAAIPLYVWNFAPHVFKPAKGAHPVVWLLLSVADVVMWVGLLLLELLGAVIKPFALMIRLFANMVAGHIVLASILLLIPIFGSYLIGVVCALGAVAISCLELFVAFLQAYIFVFLTTLFLGMYVAPEH